MRTVEEDRTRRLRLQFLQRAVAAERLPPPALTFPLEGEVNWVGRLAEFVNMKPESVISLLAEIYNFQFYAGIYMPNPAAYQIARVPMDQWQCGFCLPFEVGLKEMRVLTADPFSKMTATLFTNVRVLSGGEIKGIMPVVAPLYVVEEGLKALEEYVIKKGVHFRAPSGKLRAA